MIVDTSVWVALFRATGSPAHQRLRQALRRQEPVFMLEVVYQELLQGARDAAHFIRLQTALDAVPLWSPADSLELHRQAAMLYARCRWRGVTVRSPHDCLIAASAVEAGLPLLHDDRDFVALAAAEPRLSFVM
ncbi:PIN domain-containing protein [Ottowia sp.]|uniref:type II toxin-antitoxin system VapC family toxin n=1 Tax=Ottowia sp. TaxID=1898956 RepID=UPI002B9ACBE5|nr:PIN domain-containing protein [Ottowia sp.]HOB67938.1 PIN domain-containing protein [Ottowia sp.]HPZ58250.1 PIN domain-containing protein [Ottowia sp.]HQD49142.1 PIN domain-containing protein [Ottowia sp.]